MTDIKEPKTVDELIASSPKVLAFLKERNDSLTPEARQKYDKMIEETDVYPRVMILAMDDKAYHLISYTLSAVKESSYDSQLLGYALFQGHLSVVVALEKRVKFTDANISVLTARHLYVLGAVHGTSAIQGPLDIAIMSGKVDVINYVSSKVEIKSDSLVKAAEYGKVEFMKHTYSPTIRHEAQVEALAISLRAQNISCVEFLLERVPKSAYNADLVMASIEYEDVKTFSLIFKDAKLNEAELIEILKEIKRSNYDKHLTVVSEDSRVSQDLIKKALTEPKEQAIL